MRVDEAIKALRMESGLSQRELGDRLKVNRASVARWESGTNYPKQKVADRILELVDVIDISEKCKINIKEALMDGRRQGSSAKKFGISEIDLELICKIVDESANAVYAIEVESHKILYTNKQTEEIADFDSKKALHKTCYEYMMNRKTPCENCPLKDIKENEFSEQIILQKNKKSYLGIRGKIFRWNGKEIYITYVSNVTEFVKAEKAKQQFLDLMPTGAGIYHIYFDGKIELRYMNEEFYRIFGIRKEDSSIQPGFTLLQSVHPDDKEEFRRKIMSSIENGNRIVEANIRVDAGDGKYRRIIVRGLPIEKKKEYCTFNFSFIPVKGNVIM